VSSIEKLVPSGSQTVGPFFRIGLEWMAERAPLLGEGAEGRIEIRGRVIDRDGAPVPDALLEFWCSGGGQCDDSGDGWPRGFARAATDLEGNFAVVTMKPKPVGFGDGSMQAPHMLVLVFARGLLRHLITRVYFEGEAGISSDPVLEGIAQERRGTLVARRVSEVAGSYRWDVVLQGEQETVFFAW